MYYTRMYKKQKEYFNQYFINQIINFCKLKNHYEIKIFTSLFCPVSFLALFTVNLPLMEIYLLQAQKPLLLRKQKVICQKI